MTNAASCLDPVEDGHRHVHQNEVGRKRRDQFQRLFPVRGATDDLDPILLGQGNLEGVEEEGLVVHEKHAQTPVDRVHAASLADRAGRAAIRS